MDFEFSLMSFPPWLYIDAASPQYFVYYGLVLATDEFTGDRFLNFFLFAIADLGGVLIAMALINVVQRRLVILGAYVIIILVASGTLLFGFAVEKSNRPQVFLEFSFGRTARFERCLGARKPLY